MVFRFDDLTAEQRASGEYGFVREGAGSTRVVDGVEQTTEVYRKIPSEITNLGRVIAWTREWYWGDA